MMKSILKFLIFLSFYQLIFAYERIKLKDVQALTFYNGRYTIGRKPIAQLNCKSIHGLCQKYQPEVVQCQNVGFDGLDAQWKCNANLDKHVKFGKLSVNCEGYEYPNDPYIIAGSCGLEYELMHKDRTSSYNDNSNNETSSAPFWVFVGFVFVFVMIMFCKSSDDASNRQGYDTYRGEPTAPPPPAGFKTDYAFPKTEPTYQQSGSGLGGFWTGLGLGGLGGYLFGSRNSAPSYTSYTSPPLYTDYNYYRPSRSSSSYQDDCYSDSTPSGDTYQAEGFGSTKRR